MFSAETDAPTITRAYLPSIAPGSSVSGSTRCPISRNTPHADSSAARVSASTGPCALWLITASRSFFGWAETSSTNGRAGGRAAYGSPGIIPAIASSINAASRTVRAMGAGSGKSGPCFALLRSARDSPTRRFDSDHAAACRRYANRTTAVAALRHGMQSGGDGRGGAAAGAAGGMFEVPGISRGRTQTALGGRTQAEFGGGGFAEQNSTGVGEPDGEFRVGGRVPILVILRAEGGANIPGPDQVLERICYAEQRQHGRIRSVHFFEPGCVRERAIGGDGHECADLKIQLLDAGEKKLGNLARADLLFEDKLAQFVCLDVWIERHVHLRVKNSS